VTELPPNVSGPGREQFRKLADDLHLDLSDEELDDYLELARGAMGVYERLDELQPPTRDRRYGSRDPGYRPGPDEDPLNAHLRLCRVEGADDGPLAGYDVGVKDNVAVAGVEMTCASKVLEGYVPSHDAIAVERLLDAGATITSKNNLDEMAVSGSGEMSAFGPVRNPHDPDYLAGGSSGGSAAAIVTGDVDVALGTDQAGSLRLPAAMCGCVGFKPTHGLVPYTGAVQQGHSWDHVGPMAGTVEDAARVLEVIAGPDPLDPRCGSAEPDAYAAAADGAAGAEELTVGVLAEGFGSGHEDPGVEAACEAALDDLADAGATLADVSAPLHEDGTVVGLGVQVEDAAAMWQSEGVGHFVGGGYDESFREAFAAARRSRADDFAPTVKNIMLTGAFMRESHHGRYHARAQNLVRRLAADYADAFDGVDVLAMPTTPLTAFELVEELSRVEIVRRSQGKAGRTRNTMPFNMTGHPAISVPCGTAEGLPVGLMFVAPHHEETRLVRAGAALEAVTGYEAAVEEAA
jgi:amidase